MEIIFKSPKASKPSLARASETKNARDHSLYCVTGYKNCVFINTRQPLVTIRINLVENWPRFAAVQLTCPRGFVTFFALGFVTHLYITPSKWTPKNRQLPTLTRILVAWERSGNEIWNRLKQVLARPNIHCGCILCQPISSRISKWRCCELCKLSMSNVQITKWCESVTADKSNVTCDQAPLPPNKKGGRGRGAWLQVKCESPTLLGEEVKASVHPTPQGNTSWWIWGDSPVMPRVVCVGWWWRGDQMTGA